MVGVGRLPETERRRNAVLKKRGVGRVVANFSNRFNGKRTIERGDVWRFKPFYATRRLDVLSRVEKELRKIVGRRLRQRLLWKFDARRQHADVRLRRENALDGKFAARERARRA